MTTRERFYDTIAADFDAIMDPYDLQRRLHVVFDDLLAGEDLSGRRLLDAGSGTGHFSAAARARRAEVVAVDIGANLLREARRKGIERLAACDVARLPFADGTFDVVVSSECIEHTPSPAVSVRELARVLRPGGILVLTTPNWTWKWSCTVANTLGLRPYQGLENWPGCRELRAWLREAALSVERHVGLHAFPFVVPITRPLLRRLDQLGGALLPLYVNQCVRARKLA